MMRPDALFLIQNKIQILDVHLSTVGMYVHSAAMGAVLSCVVIVILVALLTTGYNHMRKNNVFKGNMPHMLNGHDLEDVGKRPDLLDVQQSPP